MPRTLLSSTPYGLFCEQGNFYIDPVRKVQTALITHGHSDHAYPGMGLYVTHSLNALVLRERLGSKISIQSVEYAQTIYVNGVSVTFFPAGHVIGSSQIRVEYRGEVWVVSGDFKRQEDPFAAPFEVVPCHTFITESTFGLPIFQWPTNQESANQLNTWWRLNHKRNITSILVCYSLGKAQRLLGMLDMSIGAVYAHTAAHSLNSTFIAAGIQLPQTKVFKPEHPLQEKPSLILTPSSALTGYVKLKLAPYSIAHTSGWMAIRGGTKQAEQGFVISDHTDWPGLIQTIHETGAEQIVVTHGYTQQLTQWLNEQNFQAIELKSLTA